MVQPVLRLFGASLCVILLLGSYSAVVNARYLPTRSNEDSLDKLRDLLRDILESDKPSSGHSGSHLGAFYGNDGVADRYPFAGGPKYLRKREISGWNYYEPSSLLQHQEQQQQLPLH